MGDLVICRPNEVREKSLKLYYAVFEFSLKIIQIFF